MKLAKIGVSVQVGVKRPAGCVLFYAAYRPGLPHIPVTCVQLNSCVRLPHVLPYWYSFAFR